MVNQETSESLLDTLILQIFEEQEDSFSFPLTTMKQTRDFVRLLNRQGFTYEMISDEIDEKSEAFRNWRLGGGPDAIGERTMTRINKPFQEAMLSDGEEEDEEALKNGMTGDKASGGMKRKKSIDIIARARRSSRVDSVDGEKGNVKVDSVDGKKGNVKVDSVDGKKETVKVDRVDGEKQKVEELSKKEGTKKENTENKAGVIGQASLESSKSEVDTKEGKKKATGCNDHSKPSSPNVDAKSENARVGEKRDATEKDKATTAVATAKDATPDNIKTNNAQTSKAGHDTVTENNSTTAKQESVAQAVKKDANKDHKKEEHKTEGHKTEGHKAETGKKELTKNTDTSRKEPETKTVVDEKALERNAATKPKTQVEHGPQSPDTEAKLESTKKGSKAEKKEEKRSTENQTTENETVDKDTAVSIKSPPTKNVSPKKSAEDQGRTLDELLTSWTPSSKPVPPSSPTSPSFKPAQQTSGSKQNLDAAQIPSDKEASPKTKMNTEVTPGKILETVSPPSKDPGSPGATSKDDKKSDPHKTALEKNLTSEKESDSLEKRLLPDASKTSSTSETNRTITKVPEKETPVHSTLMSPGNIVRSKSEIVESKTNEMPKAPNLARTSSDNTDVLRPSTTKSPSETDLEVTKVPSFEVDESYDSDLDCEAKDHDAKDSALIDQLLSLKRNQTKDGPGHLFVFSDTPAATGTGKHRVRIGNSRFPEKRLLQAQLFNPDIRMVTSVAVATRRDALCRVQEELKSMSLRGKRGWYWGSLDVILKVIADLSADGGEAASE